MILISTRNTKKKNMENLMIFLKFPIENLRVKKDILLRMEGNSVMKKELVLLLNTANNN